MGSRANKTERACWLERYTWHAPKCSLTLLPCGMLCFCNGSLSVHVSFSGRMAGLACAPGSLPGVCCPVLHVLWAIRLILELPYGAEPASQTMERAEGVPSCPRGPDSMVMLYVALHNPRSAILYEISTVVYFITNHLWSLPLWFSTDLWSDHMSL